MSQEFRQGCINWLPCMVSMESPGSRQLANCLVWQVQPVSITHLHHVGVTGRQGSARRFIHPTQCPALPAVCSADLSPLLWGDLGLCVRKDLETADLWGLDPNRAPHHFCHVLIANTSPDSKRTVSKNLWLILYLLLWEQEKCALLIFASWGQQSGQKHKDKARGQSSGILKTSLNSCTGPEHPISQLLDTWKHKPVKTMCLNSC